MCALGHIVGGPVAVTTDRNPGRYICRVIKSVLTWVTTTQGTPGSTLRHCKLFMWNEGRSRSTTALSFRAGYKEISV